MMGAQHAHDISHQDEASEWPEPAQGLFAEAVEAPASGGMNPLALILAVLAAAWTGLAVWSAVVQLDGAAMPDIVAAIALACVPLVLLGLIWQIFGRTSRRETERFTRAVAAVKGESAALDSVLQIMTARLEESYTRLGSETARLMTLGDEASDRLGRVTHYLSKEGATLDKKAGQLESAANAARVDIGVLLNDLPRAEEQARAVTEALRDAGFTAHAESGQLESQLSALIARGREADEVVGGAAQRLAAHLARIQSSTITATQQLDQAASGMTGAVDETLGRAAEAVDAARKSLEAQGDAMLSMIEKSRNLLEQSGEASARNLSARLEMVGGQVQALAAQLADQDANARALTEGVAQELVALEQRFAALAYAGGASNADLGQSIDRVRETIASLMSDLAAGQERAGTLAAHAREMTDAMGVVTGRLRDEVTPAFIAVEEQASRTRTATESLAPMVEGLQVGALDAATQVAAAEAAIARQRDALPALLSQMRDHVAEVEQRLAALENAARDADAEASRIVQETGPGLVDALVRVREAAVQAAERARDTINAVIPDSAARLADASRTAVSGAVGDTVAAQVEELAALSSRAADTARAASERLTRQMLGMGEAAAMLDARVDAARAARQSHDSEGFVRRVAVLIEAMNSAAVDVAKILSNEVTDSAWAAYLKGDRGVFTRRAVRLLDGREAREIARLYEQDAEFGEQVSRYIADFEAMLRRVNNERDGEALAVTILSSDMGKLYVALAQAIERLRN